MLRSPLRSPLRGPLTWPVRSNFTPAMLGAGLLAWWDSSTGVSLSGASVTNWIDKIGSLDCAQVTAANQPQFSATSFNGHPGITFDGIDDRLVMSGVGSLPTGAANVDIYAVVDRTDDQIRRIFAYGGGSNATAAFIGSGAVGVDGAFVAQAVSAAFAPGQFSGRVAVAGFVKAASVQAACAGSVGAPVATTPAIGITRIVIGANPANTGAFWLGSMRDIIVTASTDWPTRMAMLAFINSRLS